MNGVPHHQGFFGFHSKTQDEGILSNHPLLAYVQHLAEAGLAFRTINIYVSSLKAEFIRLGLRVIQLEDFTFHSLMKSLCKLKPN